MTIESNKLLTEFKSELSVPNSTFTEQTSKELTVRLFKKESSRVEYMRGTACGTNHYLDIFFEVEIPKFLKDYLKDKLPDYEIFKKSELFTKERGYGKDTYEKNFSSFVRADKMKEIEETFQMMTNDAIFLQNLEKLEDSQKVIFIQSSSKEEELRDSYNFADLNKLVGVDFHFFVCYETERSDNFGGKKTEYFGVSRKVSVHSTTGDRTDRFRNRLPYISQKLEGYTKIKWTPEREMFLKGIETKIVAISDKINEYISGINDDNFELMMTKFKMLPNHTED